MGVTAQPTPNLPRIDAFGDSALLVTFGDRLDPTMNDKVHLLHAHLTALGDPRIIESVPAYATLTIEYDPLRMTYEEAAQLVEEVSRLDLLAKSRQETAPTGIIEIPTLYGGERGFDLADVAAARGLSAAEVVRRHTAVTYRVYMVGFTPGFGYLGALDPTLATPRRATPRPRVPAGSVAIGGKQTGVYAQTTPGGWHVIGHTPLRFFDPHNAERPTLLRPGDRVCFRAVDVAEYDSLTPPPLLPPDVPEGDNQIEVLEAGGVGLVQDGGRAGKGYGALGLPPGGALDFHALRAANTLVDNAPDAPALEFFQHGPTLRFARSTLIALTGADMGAVLDGQRVVLSMAWWVRAGGVLRFDGVRVGARAWLAVAGGIAAAHELGSASASPTIGIGGHRGGGQPMAAGDVLGILPTHGYRYGLAGRSLSAPSLQATVMTIRAVRSPHPALLGDVADRFFDSDFRVLPASDRMGVRLGAADGSPFALALDGWHRPPDLLSFGVVTGAMQLPPDGRPIALLADRQTTGGYPIVAVVCKADLHLLAQAAPGTTLRFAPISVGDAQHAYRNE